MDEEDFAPVVHDDASSRVSKGSGGKQSAQRRNRQHYADPRAVHDLKKNPAKLLVDNILPGKCGWILEKQKLHGPLPPSFLFELKCILATKAETQMPANVRPTMRTGQKYTSRNASFGAWLANHG